MTTTEALDIAIAALREKCEKDRVALPTLERRPNLARHVDPHTSVRYQRNMQAVILLGDLRAREASPDSELEVQP